MLLIKKGTEQNPIPIVVSTDVAIGQYSVTWNSQEYSAYRDCNGLLHRNSIASRPPKCEFYTRNGMTGGQLATFYARIRNQFSDAKEKKISNAQIFVPELNRYITDDIYLADSTPAIDHIDEATNTIYYKSFRVAFIGYGTESSYGS